VARIVTQHEGFVNVKSELDRGTTFEIYLPRVATAPVSESSPTPANHFKRGQGEVILVADDEQAVLEMVSLTLSEQGYRVITATNGAEAIAKMESSGAPVRLALLDTDMPVMNGPQTISALHAYAPNLPVVLMSGEITSIPGQRNVSTLAKPFQLQELLSAVANHLNGH
jgi:CheY-like chemotaxis protein